MGWLERWWNSERQATLRRIAVANAFVVFITFYSDWGLSEVSLAYAGELVILMFVVWARALCARRLPAGWPGRRRGTWPLALAKAYAILITACMFLLFSGINVLIVFGLIYKWHLPSAVAHSLILAWLAFSVSHVLDFVATWKLGAYDELIDDGSAMAPLFRWPVMIFAFVGASAEHGPGEPFPNWYFLAVLAGMALVNVFLQVAEMDRIRVAAWRRRESVPLSARNQALAD